MRQDSSLDLSPHGIYRHDMTRFAEVNSFLAHLGLLPEASRHKFMAMTATDKNANSPDINIRHNLKPGDIGYLTYLHGLFYADACGWGQTFEADVACIMADFARSHNDRERIWVVEQDGKVAGSIGIVESTPADAQLRILLLHPNLRGRGVGKKLIAEAIQFCRERGYGRIFLSTTSELTAAANLYRAAGFQLTESHTYEMWGTTVTEQRYELNL